MIGPLPYIGGKRRVARRLVALIPAHTTYVEPFAGGAQVFFHKPRSANEVLNDLDEEVINFLRVCQRHPQELVRWLRWQPASRRWFAQVRAQALDGLTDIERAARFFFLQKNAWSGLRHRQTFHYSVTKPVNYRSDLLPARLRQVAERLDRVQLDALPYEDVFHRYDRPTTFFYCDPPYVGVRWYRHNLTDDHFVRLAEQLRQIKGRFLLSINDCPKARRWFEGFACLPITFTYTSMRTPRRFPELLFANYLLPTSLPRP